MLTGIIASTSGILPAFTDEFTGTNGTALPSKWNNINGAWQIQINKAVTYSSPTLNPLTTFTANTKNVSIRANAGEINQGWGTAFWVNSSNTWWAAVTERTQFFGCSGTDTNNGNGTCTAAAYSYTYDCSGNVTTTTAAYCGTGGDYSETNNGVCALAVAGGLNCGNTNTGAPASCAMCGVNGCCGYTYSSPASGFGFCGPGQVYYSSSDTCGGSSGCCLYGYYVCMNVNNNWFVYHPATTTTTYVVATCTANVAAVTYNATTYYTHKLKLIKSVDGTVTEMGSVDVGTNATTPGGIGYVQVVTNEAGQITATAQLSTGGAVAQIQQTPTATRATKHGIIVRTAASGAQASTIESFVYSPV
jgi:hypothetical protein